MELHLSPYFFVFDIVEIEHDLASGPANAGELKTPLDPYQVDRVEVDAGYGLFIQTLIAASSG